MMLLYLAMFERPAIANLLSVVTMRLYIIRHADPDYPNNTITPAGHLEAKARGDAHGKRRA